MEFRARVHLDKIAVSSNVAKFSFRMIMLKEEHVSTFMLVSRFKKNRGHPSWYAPHRASIFEDFCRDHPHILKAMRRNDVDIVLFNHIIIGSCDNYLTLYKLGRLEQDRRYWYLPDTLPEHREMAKALWAAAPIHRPSQGGWPDRQATTL